MKLWIFCLAGAFWWGILRFVIGSKIRRTLVEGTPEQKMRAIGRMPVVGLLGWAALLSAISAAALLVAGWWVSLQGGASLPQFEALLQRLEGVRHWLENMSLGWFILIAVVGLAGLSKLLCERSRGSLKAALDARVQREIDSLRQKAARGEIEELPPTAEMARVAEMVDGVDDAIAQARSRGASTEETQYREHREKLIDAYRTMDIRRRLNLDLDERDLPMRKPETTWDRIGFALFSEGVASQASGGTLILVAVLSMLLLPAWVGVQREGLSELIEQRIATVEEQRNNEVLRLQDLALAANRTAAVKALEEAIEKTPKADAKEKDEDDDTDTINTVASYAEYRYFAARGVKAPAVSSTAVAKARAASSRDRILEKHASMAAGSVEHVSSADGYTPGAKGFSEAVARAEKPPKPQSTFGQRVAEDLQRAAKRNGSFLKNLRESFQRTATAESISRIFVSQLGSSVLASSERPAGGGTEPFAKAAYAEADVFATSVVEGKPFEDAVRATNAVVEEKRFISPADDVTYRQRASGKTMSVAAEDMAAIVDLHPPSLKVKQTMSAEAAKHADELLVRNARFAGFSGEAENYARALQDYDSTFAYRPKAELQTPYGRATELVAKESVNPESKSMYGVPHEPPHDPPVAPFNNPGKPGPPGPSRNGPSLAEPNPGPSKSPVGRTASVPNVRRTDSRIFREGAVQGGSAVGSSSANFTRGRSFMKLRGFAKVGGVLIGRDPSGTSQTAVTDFGWEETADGRVRIRVTFRDGSTLTSIPHDPDALYRAIIYAADQRPTAVTMVTAEPLMELKILLHPSLLDTRLGEQISDLDRFVDTYAGRDPQKSNSFPPLIRAIQDVESARSLYELAWAARRESAAAALEEEYGGALASLPRSRTALSDNDKKAVAEMEETVAAMRQLRVEMEKILSEPGRRKLAAPLLPLLAGSTDELHRRTPLVSKSEFYDPQLLSMMRAAVKQTPKPSATGRASLGTAVSPPIESPFASADRPEETEQGSIPSMDGFISRVKAAAREEVYPAKATSSFGSPGLRSPRGGPGIAGRGLGIYDSLKVERKLNESAFKRAMKGPPKYEPWSGVREREYELLPASLVMTTGDGPVPLNFMFQVAFVTAPGFLPNGREDADYADEHPWEFEGIKEQLEAAVMSKVRANPESAEVLRRAAEFTYLQRFFRNAFNGRLGEDFPFVKVEELSSNLAAKQPAPKRNPRWNSRRGSLEASLVKVMEKSLGDSSLSISQPTTEWLKQALPEMKAGLQLLADADRLAHRMLAEADEKTRAAEVWRKRWDQHWADSERKRAKWEIAWDERMSGLLDARNALQKKDPEAWSESAEGALLVAIHQWSTAIALRRTLGVHEDDKLMMERQAAASHGSQGEPSPR
jgi:hypothetical protein